MIWVARTFIVVGALLVFLAAAIGMHQVERSTISDAAIIICIASICLGLLMLAVGCSLENDELDYKQAEDSWDA